MKEFKLSDIVKKLSFKGLLNKRDVHREINLVPEIKDDMIKSLKLRNYIFFACIVVASISIGITIVYSTIMGGQQIAIEAKKGTIEKLSKKIMSYQDLNDYLTIKDQVNNINEIADKKKVLSRSFNILSALLPTGADTIKISQLNVDLDDENPVFRFDAQANSGTEPFIDYAVLEAFKKSMDEMRYDYGRYVDKEGNTIPAYCMIESGGDGAVFTDVGNRGLSNQDVNSIYAYWTIEEEGCNPSGKSEVLLARDYQFEDYNSKKVVRIWRTPQKNWYNGEDSGNLPSITLDGTITNVAHFESSCTTYTGEITNGSSTPVWTKKNDDCKLVLGGSSEGIVISESSNGRNSDDQLVLRFSASIVISPEAYRFDNFHMLAVAPSGRHNVTDSYVQVQAMFGAKAVDCAEGDTACNSNTQNINGGSK